MRDEEGRKWTLRKQSLNSQSRRILASFSPFTYPQHETHQLGRTQTSESIYRPCCFGCCGRCPVDQHQCLFKECRSLQWLDHICLCHTLKYFHTLCFNQCRYSTHVVAWFKRRRRGQTILLGSPRESHQGFWTLQLLLPRVQKIMMNPFFDAQFTIQSTQFDFKVKAAAKRYLQ